MDLKTLVSTLQAFIEGSTLGEFQARLQVLLVFHCHVLLMPQVAERGKLLALPLMSYLYSIPIFSHQVFRLSRQVTELTNRTRANRAV